MRQAATPAHAAMRIVAVALLAASLLALAAVPGAPGLAAAALLWILAYALLESGWRMRSAK